MNVTGTSITIFRNVRLCIWVSTPWFPAKARLSSVLDEGWVS